MKTQTLVESLSCIKKYKDNGTLTTEQAYEITMLFQQAYVEGQENEQVQNIS